MSTEPLKAELKTLAKHVLSTAQLLDPSRLALPPARPDCGNVGFVAVYRSRYAQHLFGLLAQLGPRATIRLWCLDEPVVELKTHTVGTGPGSRFSLLNRLIESIPADRRDDGLVVSDDDYVFRVGTLDQLVSAGRGVGLDVWQPAHGRLSHVSSRFVRRRAGVALRRTTFVEQGPVLVLSARAQRVLLPLPEDLGMGWGAELRWASIVAEHSLQLGILDALAIQHLPPTGEYDRSAQAAQLRLMLDDAGLPTFEHLQRELTREGIRRGRRLMRSQPPPTSRP
ncbi:MAG: hypothetical protein ACRYG2_15925 [Janthinobacterium lividum]